MPQAASQTPGIFICYRRDDTAGHAGRLYDRLAAHFGGKGVFMDIDLIEPGEDFVQVIEEAVGSCDTLLVLIGRNWLTSRDEVGRRIDNPNDFVRLEIASALARGVRVIPVLLQGAQMPRAEDLPEDLSPLARRNGLELSDLRWNYDVDRLIGSLERAAARQRGQETGPARKKAEPPAAAGGTKGEAAASVPPAVESEKRGGGKGKYVVFAAAAVLLLVVAAFSAQWVLSRRAPRTVDTNRAAALNQQAVALNNRGAHDEAIRVSAEALTFDPTYSPAYNNRGFAHFKKGAVDLAIKDYTESIGLAPSAFAYANRAEAYHSKGRFDDAIGDATHAIALDPQSVYAYSVRGNAHHSKGDYATAVQDYTKAIGINPRDPDLYGNRANSYDGLGRKDLAAADRQSAELLRRGITPGK